MHSLANISARPPALHRRDPNTPGEGEHAADESAGSHASASFKVAPKERGQLSAPYLLLMDGERQGELVRIDRDDFILGREAQPTLPLAHRAISRLHAKIYRDNGQWFLQDLASKNGTLLNHQTISEPTKLRDDDLINLGNGAIFRYIDDTLADEVYRVRFVMIGPRDPMTNTMAPNDFEGRARAELAFHLKYDLHLSYVLAEVDQTIGAEDNTVVVKELARRLRQGLRKRDQLCHLGRHQFAFLFPQTSRAEALKFAEVTRRAIAEKPFHVGTKAKKITLSFGVAAVSAHLNTLEGLRSFAQFALEIAQLQGGNCVNSSQ